MLIVSVFRRSMLTRYERASSQETAVKESSRADSSAAALIHRDQSKFFQLSRLARSFETDCGGKRVRVKKYGCGKSAGPENALAAFRIASVRELRAAHARKGRTPASRSGDGSKRENDIMRATCGVELNVEYPPKISSLPRPERATFSPAWRAAQETKNVFTPSTLG